MKAKHVLWIITGIVAAVAIAAGVAVFIDRVLHKEKPIDGYIECECEPEE